MGVEGLSAAIERSQLFMEAGVDMAKPIGVDTIADIKRVIREVPGPHMATLSQAAGRKERSLKEFGTEAGVVAATFPSLPIFAAAHAVRSVLRTLKRENSMTPTFDQLLTLDEYYDLVGLKEQLAKEESYDKAAAALVQKRAAEEANTLSTELHRFSQDRVSRRQNHCAGARSSRTRGIVEETSRKKTGPKN